MILIISSEHEPNVNRVIKLLDYHGVDWFRLNGEDIPLKTKLHLDFQKGLEASNLVNEDGKKVALNKISCVWNRRYGEYKLTDEFSDEYKNLIKHESFYAYQFLFLVLKHLPWMNDYASSLIAYNRLYQSHIAKKVGLRIPASIVTQSCEEARAFEAVEQKLLTKVINQGLPSEGSGKMIFSSVIDDELYSYSDLLKNCPTLLQSYIEKNVELRIVIVGQDVFPSAIESQSSDLAKEDWRKDDFSNIRQYPFKLPDEITNKLMALMREMGLVYGTVDMVLTNEGDYVFLEVNPGGQWDWTQKLCGYNIDKSIASWMIEYERKKES